MNQIIKKVGLVLVLCLMTIWGQLAWLVGLVWVNPISHSLLVLGMLIMSGLFFCWLIRYVSLFVSNKGLSTPAWLKSMAQLLAHKLKIPTPEVHTLSTTGLNAFAIDNLTGLSVVYLIQQTDVQATDHGFRLQ